MMKAVFVFAIAALCVCFASGAAAAKAPTPPVFPETYLYSFRFYIPAEKVCVLF